MHLNAITHNARLTVTTLTHVALGLRAARAQSAPPSWKGDEWRAFGRRRTIPPADFRIKMCFAKFGQGVCND